MDKPIKNDDYIKSKYSGKLPYKLLAAYINKGADIISKKGGALQKNSRKKVLMSYKIEWMYYHKNFIKMKLYLRMKILFLKHNQELDPFMHAPSMI